MAKSLRAERQTKNELDCICPVCGAHLKINEDDLYVSAVPPDEVPDEDIADPMDTEDGRGESAPKPVEDSIPHKREIEDLIG